MKILAEISDIFKVDAKFMNEHYRYCLYYFKDNANFYVKCVGRIKSSRCYYIFNLLKVSEDLSDKNHYYYASDIRLTRQNILDYGESMKKLDKVDLAQLIMYSDYI